MAENITRDEIEKAIKSGNPEYKNMLEKADSNTLIAIADEADYDTLEKLSHSSNKDVILAVLDSWHSADLRPLKHLADFQDKDVKLKLLNNKYWFQDLIYKELDNEDIEIRNTARKKLMPEYVFMHDYYHLPNLFDNDVFKILLVDAYFSDMGKKMINQMPDEYRKYLYVTVNSFVRDRYGPAGSAEVRKFIADFTNWEKQYDGLELDIAKRGMTNLPDGATVSKKIISEFPDTRKKTSKSLNIKNGKEINLDKYLERALSVQNKEAVNSEFVDKKKIKKSSCAVLNCNEANTLKQVLNENEVEYGEYPQDNAPIAENVLLEVLYKYGQLEKTNKQYKVNGLLDSTIYDEYKVNDRKFIRVGFKDYVEVKPILWHLDDNLLVSNQAIFSGNVDKEILDKFFNESILQPKQKSDKFSDNGLNHDDKIQAKKMIDEETQKKLKELEDQMINMLAQIKETSEAYEQLSNKKMGQRVAIDKDLLLVKVDDHIEFNEKYIPYLKYIDLSIVPSDNLKASGINFIGTNIVINPQAVYNRDLSNSSFGNNNIIFGLFDGCNLSGTNLEDEKESLVFDNAIIDDATRLPENVNNMSNQL